MNPKDHSFVGDYDTSFTYEHNNVITFGENVKHFSYKIMKINDRSNVEKHNAVLDHEKEKIMDTSNSENLYEAPKDRRIDILP